MKIIDCKQGTTAWLQARCGIPTASEFDSLVTPLWKHRSGDGPETYLLTKVAERIMGYPAQSWGGGAMEQGSLLEDEALPWYEFAHGVEIQRVGLCTTDDGKIGCSPDGLIGEDNGIEIKCPQPHTHLKYLLGGVVPKEYAAQVQGAMLVTGRPKWTFLSYNRFFPPLLVHVEKDPIAQQVLKDALDKFNDDLTTALVKIQAKITMPGRQP